MPGQKSQRGENDQAGEEDEQAGAHGNTILKNRSCGDHPSITLLLPMLGLTEYSRAGDAALTVSVTRHARRPCIEKVAGAVAERFAVGSLGSAHL
jgi:hypothetical protein